MSFGHGPISRISVSNGNTRQTCSCVTVTSSRIANIKPNGDRRHSFLSRTFSSFVCTVVIRRLNLFNTFYITFFCVILVCHAKEVTSQYRGGFPTFLTVNLTLVLAMRTLFGVYITINLTPVANRPLPLIDGNNASAIVGYVCVNIVLSVDHSTGHHILLPSNARRPSSAAPSPGPTVPRRWSPSSAQQ